MIYFLLGLIVGFLIEVTIAITAFFILTKHKETIIRQITKYETAVKQPISIIKRTSEAEEAYKHILEINKDRGGIPDSELK